MTHSIQPDHKQTAAPAELLSEHEQQQLDLLRAHRRTHRHRQVVHPAAPLHVLPVGLTRGQRFADKVASTIGSWRFILFQSTAIAIRITGTVLAGRAGDRVGGTTALSHGLALKPSSIHGHG